MKAKRFISLILVACVLTCCLLTGCSGGKSDVIKIGIMQFGEFDALQKAYQGFADGLADAGYKDGEKVRLHCLSAAADTANCPTIADTLLNEGSDLILAIATPSVTAMKQKTTTVPVLFTAVTDPVASGLIDDAACPGGNLTGTSDLNPVAEQIDLVQTLFPDVQSVAVLYCSSESNSATQYEAAKAQLDKLGLGCVQKAVSSMDEVKFAVESLAGQVQAIYIPTDNMLSDGISAVVAAANSVGLPIIAGEPGMVGGGALATYGIDYYELGKQTANMAVRILESDDPLAATAAMPVEYQTKECVVAVNTETAAALGIELPADILETAELYPQG